MKPQRLANPIVRVLVTIGLLGAALLYDLRLPGIEPPGISFFALGIRPFVVSFVIGEILSLVIPAGRRLREGGTAGRSRLNYFGEYLGMVMAAAQGAGIAIAMQRQGLVEKPGWLFILMSAGALMIGAAWMAAFARMIFFWGVGNGFVWMMLIPPIGAFLQARDNGIRLLEIVLCIAAFGIITAIFVRRPKMVLVEGSQSIPVRLPAFPQGVVSIGWTYALLAFASIPLFAAGLLIAGLSVVTFYLFSSRRRFERNLPTGVMPSERQLVTWRWLIMTTTVLAGFSVAFGVINADFVIVVPLVAFAIDLVAEWRFRWRNAGGTTQLLELDNIYAACYLQGLLTQARVDSIVRSFHYRSLFFFLGPIIKMELLVPVADEERAREIVRPNRIKIV